MSDTKLEMPFRFTKQEKEEPICPFIFTNPPTSEQQNPSTLPAGQNPDADAAIGNAQGGNLGSCAVSSNLSTQPMISAQPNPDVGTSVKKRVIKVNGDPGYSSDPSMMPPAMCPDNVSQVPFSPSQLVNASVPYAYPAQQQTLPPAVPQPSQMAVIDKNSVDTFGVNNSHEIFVDYKENKMYLLRQKTRNKKNSSNACINGGQRSVYKSENKSSLVFEKTELAKGTISVVSKVIKPKGEFLSVELKGENGKITKCELTFYQINEKRYLNKVLLESKLNYDANNLKYIIEWLRTQYSLTEAYREPVDDVKNGRPFYRDADNIRKKAADTLRVRDEISSYIADNINGNLKLFLLALGCVSKMPLFLSANKLDIRTVVAFCVSDMGMVVGDLSRIYSLDGNSMKGLSEFKDEILESNNMTLLFTRGETDHKLKKGLADLAGYIEMNGVTHKALGLPIFVFDNRSMLKKFDMSKYLVVQYSLTDTTDKTDILCWFQKKMMDDEHFATNLLDLINRYKVKISEEQIQSPKTDLYAILLGTAGTIIRYSDFSSEQADKIVDEFYDWFNSSAVDSSSITKAFCDYIKSSVLPLKSVYEYSADDGKTIYLDDEYLCITMSVFKDAAYALNIEKALLAKQIYEDGFLETGGDKYQKYIKTRSGSHNFYVIPLSKLSRKKEYPEKPKQMA